MQRTVLSQFGTAGANGSFCSRAAVSIGSACETDRLWRAYKGRRSTADDDQILSLVRLAVSVLAAGAGRAGAVSLRLAGAFAVPDCRHRCRWGTGVGPRNHHLAGTHFEWAAEGITHRRKAKAAGLKPPALH